MSFIYPRLVTITRPNSVTGIGAQSYQALNKNSETIIVSNVRASIQLKRKLQVSMAKLPGDTINNTSYDVFLKLSLGTIKERDIITDDLGCRYQVIASYWDSLGYRCDCEKLLI
jgi:hypothetical protein